jgi:hypothetical protein
VVTAFDCVGHGVQHACIALIVFRGGAQELDCAGTLLGDAIPPAAPELLPRRVEGHAW